MNSSVTRRFPILERDKTSDFYLEVRNVAAAALISSSVGRFTTAKYSTFYNIR